MLGRFFWSCLLMALLGTASFGCGGEAEIFVSIGDSPRDITPPTIRSVQPPEGTVIPPGSTVSVTVVVTDNRGVREVLLVAASIPGVDFPDSTPLEIEQRAPFTFTFTFPKEGRAFLTFEVLDFAENSASITVTYQIADTFP